jgi:undecaprenyl-diphosphatase
LFKDHVEGPLRSLRVIAVALIVVAVLMAVADRLASRASGGSQRGCRLRDALLIGAAQALALVPGVSRSGITLVAGMALGLRRDAAARFSFLLSVPAIGAAGVFECPTVLRAQGVSKSVLIRAC